MSNKVNNIILCDVFYYITLLKEKKVTEWDISINNGVTTMCMSLTL